MKSFKLIEFFTTAARSIAVAIISGSACVCVLTISENRNDPENEEDLTNLDGLKNSK